MHASTARRQREPSASNKSMLVGFRTIGTYGNLLKPSARPDCCGCSCASGNCSCVALGRCSRRGSTSSMDGGGKPRREQVAEDAGSDRSVRLALGPLATVSRGSLIFRRDGPAIFFMAASLPAGGWEPRMNPGSAAPTRSHPAPRAGQVLTNKQGSAKDAKRQRGKEAKDANHVRCGVGFGCYTATDCGLPGWRGSIPS